MTSELVRSKPLAPDKSFEPTKLALPENPTDLVYEDFVAAWLSALGYFIETRIREHNVLELDVVASDMSLPPVRTLVEAKSGSWGMPDMFKVYGWRMYLEIPRGLVVALSAPDAAKQTLLERVAKRTKVDAAHVSPSKILWNGPMAAVSAVDENLRGKLLDVAWRGRLAARRARESFENVTKSAADDELFQRARRYDAAVEASFFSPNAQERIENLYAAYKESPNLTGEFVERLAKKLGDDEDATYRALENDPVALHVQHVMALEHRARILIIRYALEIAMPNKGDKVALAKFRRAFPKSFREGLDALHRTEFRARVPYALQLFFEYFGGMHDGEADLESLATYCGLKVEQVEKAIEMLDVFFPGTGTWSWCSTSHLGRLTRLKLCPAIVRGAGAILHRLTRGHADFRHLKDRASLYAKWETSLNAIVQPAIAKC